MIRRTTSPAFIIFFRILLTLPFVYGRKALTEIDKIKSSVVINKVQTIAEKVGSTKAFQFMVKNFQNAIIIYFTIEFLAFVGVIGKTGESVEDFIVSQYPTLVHRLQDELDLRPGGKLRERAQNYIVNYHAKPRKKRFAVSISTGVALFPVLVKVILYTIQFLLPLFLVAEIFAFMGVLGKKGEGISDWIDDDIRILKSQLKWINKQRLMVRKTLKLNELVMQVVNATKKDYVSMFGLVTGAVASAILWN